MNHSTMMSAASPSDPKEIHVRLKHIAKFFGSYAATLLCSGATTMRIERKLRQMAEAWHVQAEFTILPTNVILNIWDASGDHSYSCISPLLHGALNFDLITRLSRLSDDVFTQNLVPAEAVRRFDAIKNIPRFSSFAVLVLASAANASFCRLFGGDWAAIGIVFAATFCGFFVKQRLSGWKMDYRAVTIISAVTAAVISCVGYVIPDLSTTPDIALGTSVLYLVPGVPFCNFVNDLLYGHYICAFSRFVQAMMITVSLSIGLVLALLMLNIRMLSPVSAFDTLFSPSPHNHSPFSMSTLLDLLNDGFFAAIAAIGFASISNPKRSTFWSLGLLAALGHVTRFILMHYFDVHIALASFAGGLIIGIVSIPMSTVVNSPAETLSFPALLPMVPGKFAYGSIQALVECMSHKTEDHFNHYFYLLNYNWITCVLTIVLMVIGVTIPLFTFRNHGLVMLRRMRDELLAAAHLRSSHH